MPPRLCFVSLWVYSYFNADLGYEAGGAQRQIYLLSTALADEFDVHVIVGDYGQPKREVRDGVTLHRAYPLRPRQHLLQPAKHFGQLCAAMRRADADIYIDRNSPKKTAVVGPIAKLLGAQFVYHVANDANLTTRRQSLRRPLRASYDWTVRNADLRIAQTPRQRELFQTHAGVDARVIPNGYPPATDPPSHDDRFGYVWVGRLDSTQKRPHLVLDLAEAVPSASFTLIGPVEESNTYHQRIRQRAASLDNVTIEGAVPPDEIHEYYRQAQALIHTSRSGHEGFPNVFLEAWRQGTPVLSLGIDPGRFIDVDAGYAAEDLETLQQVVERGVEDPAFLRELGERSLAEFESTYSVSRLADSYAEAIATI